MNGAHVGNTRIAKWLDRPGWCHRASPFPSLNNIIIANSNTKWSPVKPRSSELINFTRSLVSSANIFSQSTSNLKRRESFNLIPRKTSTNSWVKYHKRIVQSCIKWCKSVGGTFIMLTSLHYWWEISQMFHHWSFDLNIRGWGKMLPIITSRESNWDTSSSSQRR